MNFKKRVKSIETAGCNGARMVYEFYQFTKYFRIFLSILANLGKNYGLTGGWILEVILKIDPSL